MDYDYDTPSPTYPEPEQDTWSTDSVIDCDWSQCTWDTDGNTWCWD